MSKPKHLSYKWVIIGGGVIITLQFLMRLLLVGSVAETIVAGLGPLTGELVVAGIVAFVAYFVGGMLIGMFSPGETVKEPSLATLMAIVPNIFNQFILLVETNQRVLPYALGWGITLAVGMLMAFAGAWLGEKFQGRTVEKLREEGELPPAPGSSEGEEGA
jgi:hypothetical protein